MPKHCHVLVGLEGGYLPDSNYYFADRRVARAAAKAEAEHLADYEYDEESGAKASVAGGPDLYTLEIENASPTHLRTYVEVADCDDESCKDEE